MKSIKVIISAAKCRVGVKYKQICTSNHCTSYFKDGRRLSILSAIILAILLLASCTKDGSNLSFHNTKEALDAQKEFLSSMKSNQDLSMEHLADKISKWRILENSVSACLMRDTIKKAHSFPMEDFSNVHDSIRDEFMRIATAKRRTFKDVLLLKMKATPYKGMKETDSLSIVASRFFESLDSLPEYKGDKTRILTTYHFFLEKVKKEGIANQSQFLAFLKVMLHKFLNDFLALAPLQLPELINQERMEQPVYEDGYVLLDFKLEKSYSLEEVMNLLEDQMELIILYHKVTSVHTEFGQFCCAFSNPNFGRMYKMNASTDANGNVHSIIVTIYESLEFMYGDLCHELELQARTGFFKYKRDKADMLLCFM